MSEAGTSGWELARLFERGVNLATVMNGRDLGGIAASHIDSPMLIFEQSPYGDRDVSRMRILSVLKEGGPYRDENRAAFILSNNLSLSDGTFVHLEEARRDDMPQPLSCQIPDELPNAVLRAAIDVSHLAATVEGCFTKLRVGFLFDKLTSSTPLEANMSGTYRDDETYRRFIEIMRSNQIVDVIPAPTTAKSVATIQYVVRTPETSCLMNILMHDHRGDTVNEHQRLRAAASGSI